MTSTVEEFSDKRTLRDIILWALFFLAWAVLRVRSPPYVIEHGADYYFAIFLFLIFMGIFLHNLGKYKTPMFISNGVWGSCSCRPIIEGDWAIFRLGGIRWGIFLKGSEKTAIVPKGSIKKVGECWFTTARTERVNLEEVPYDVQKSLEAENHNVDLIYIGYTTEYYEMVHEDFIHLERECERLNNVLSAYRKAMKGKYSAIESQVNWLDRIKGRKPKTMIDRATRSPEDEE